MPSAAERLTALRQYQASGERAPHKPLLVLLALGQLVDTGSSRLEWSDVESRLGQLLAEFGPPTRAGAPSPAYPFTRLRSDGVWQLSREVPNDNLGPLREAPIDGMFTADIEAELHENPEEVPRIAQAIALSQFAPSLVPDGLAAVGLESEMNVGGVSVDLVSIRRRSASWRMQVIAAWDRACAFCGFDGSLGGAPVGIEAAHVRWFTFGGPDSPDNGLALCSLHHKLLDRGVLGLADSETVVVSDAYATVSEAGRLVYDLHGRRLRPRPGTALPAMEHVGWHRDQVFKGVALAS